LPAVAAGVAGCHLLAAAIVLCDAAVDADADDASPLRGSVRATQPPPQGALPSPRKRDETIWIEAGAQTQLNGVLE
jgi:hypothetical protein